MGFSRIALDSRPRRFHAGTTVNCRVSHAVVWWIATSVQLRHWCCCVEFRSRILDTKYMASSDPFRVSMKVPGYA